MINSYSIIDFAKNRKNLFTWLVFFFITAFIGYLVQLVLLPYIFPGWHAGYGLLTGGDWTSFHREAVAMAERIKIEGWSAWELRPRGWMPAGVAGAIYALTRPLPLVMIPLNAAVQATTILLVVRIMLLFVPSWKTALVAALPFAFFPSAMLWYTQIHRDGYQILGIMLYLYGLLMVVSLSRQNVLGWNIILKGLVMSGAGLAMIWLVRPHSLVIFQYMTILLLLFVASFMVYLSLRYKSCWKNMIMQLLFFCLIIAAITPLTKTAGAAKYQVEAIYELDIMDTGVKQSENDNSKYNWQKISWLPKQVDDKLFFIAYLRAVSFPEKYGQTASGIDYDHTFHNVYDFFAYLPRALQISFLAPFPNLWFGEGKYESTTFFRRVSALEMIFVYLSLPFLIYGIGFWRKKLELWVLVIFCTVMMLPIVYSVPNVGTIYRYRYGYLMLLVAVGVAAFIRWLQRSKIDKETSDGKKYG